MSDDTEPLYEPTASIDLPEFEGTIPVGVVTSVTGTGQRITRPIHYGEKIVLVVEAEATNIGHRKTTDGMKRVHTLSAVDLYELPGEAGQKLLRQQRAEWRVADDQVHGRQALGLDDTTQAVLSVDGVILTAREIAEQRGDSMPDDDASLIVEFEDGTRGVWPEDWLGLGQSLAAVGGSMRLPGSAEVGDTARVMRWLDVEDPTSVVAEWSDADEAARLLALEQEAERAEAAADREVVEGMPRPDDFDDDPDRIGTPWDRYGSMKIDELRENIAVASLGDLRYALRWEHEHKGRVTVEKCIRDRIALLEGDQ